MKNKYLLLPVFVAFIAVILSACNNSNCEKGSGKQVTETRKVAGFSKLDIMGGYKIIIRQDTAESVSVTGDDNLITFIKTDVSGDKLRIKTTHGICSSGAIVINIAVRDLSLIKASGAVDLSSPSRFNLKDLEFDLSGSNKITLDLNAANIDTHSSGIVELNLTGQAASHTVHISGTCKLNALDFVVAKYSIQTSGSSHCKINVLNQLDVNSSGASDIEYRGNPGSVNNSKAGASSLKKIE